MDRPQVYQPTVQLRTDSKRLCCCTTRVGSRKVIDEGNGAQGSLVATPWAGSCGLGRRWFQDWPLKGSLLGEILRKSLGPVLGLRPNAACLSFSSIALCDGVAVFYLRC